MRLPKFEVDIPAASKAQKTGLLERDVTLANMWVASHLQPPWFCCSIAKLSVRFMILRILDVLSAVMAMWLLEQLGYVVSLHPCFKANVFMFDKCVVS